MSALVPLGSWAHHRTRHCKKHGVDEPPSTRQTHAARDPPPNQVPGTFWAQPPGLSSGPSNTQDPMADPTGWWHVLGPWGGIRGSQAPPGRAAGITCGLRLSQSGVAKRGLHGHTWCQQPTGAPFGNISPKQCSDKSTGASCTRWLCQLNRSLPQQSHTVHPDRCHANALQMYFMRTYKTSSAF